MIALKTSTPRDILQLWKILQNQQHAAGSMYVGSVR